MQSAQQSKCDIVFLAKGRTEFTVASLQALQANTNWERVSKLYCYTDEAFYPLPGILRNAFDSPVVVMMDYLEGGPSPLWVKLDNDVIVPPGWLDTCLDVMDAHLDLDLLGIEPPMSRTAAPWANGKRVAAPESQCATPGYAPCNSIGGIGLFRSRAWQNRPAMRPFATYGGFTDWQLREGRKGLKIGWIVPPLKLFLLDRLPIEPWASLSRRYIAEGLQRPWTAYTEAEAAALAGWWLE